ncbi:KAP family P-loop NTPase fold protein [Novosphingobium jiangmenense]|uniref:NTPase KAP n=1 Tax=Novosphingobium jiangmenense TaxID=2791981 RepID=A0ABS0HF76_9SPHN|nr:P-loop NTPase fold protein [Novosphingobium jiangmenense]MBF9150893.1 NTPase KAP [Novosphingobium jiangmenense]
MTSQPFHGDRPIQSKDEDRFGFSALAERIADALTSQAAEKGFVFGLEGKWGSGKSSLLALILKQLSARKKTDVNVVEFRPWLIGDRDQLLAALFEDLAKAVAEAEHAAGDATGTSVRAVKGVAEQIRSFASHLAPVGKLTSLAGLIVPGATQLGDIVSKIAEAAAERSEGPSLVEQKEKLSEALRQLGCRIVVTIDDVDRLEPSEVRELLRLVRSVADFPNVTYLLCYDARALERSIETSTGVANGAAYLEKIIQTEVAVPRPESFALRRWFLAELQTFTECGHRRVSELQMVIDETGGRVLNSPRAVVRVLDSIRAFWPSLKGRVDLADLVWLRMTAVGSPNFYRWAEEYVTHFVAQSTGRAHVSESERILSVKEMEQALVADGLSWEKLCYEMHRHLPGIEVGRFNSDREERLYAKNVRNSAAQDIMDKRLASPSHARIYFTLLDPPDGVTEQDQNEFVAAAVSDWKDVAEVLHRMSAHRGDAGATKAERMLDNLLHFDAEYLKKLAIENLIVGLAEAADRLAGAEQVDAWGSPRAWYLTIRIYRRLAEVYPSKKFRAALVKISKHSSSLGFLTELLRRETFALGVYGNRRDPDKALGDRETFDRIAAVMIKRFRRMGLEGVMAHPCATDMLYAWSQAGGRDELNKEIERKSEDDDWLLAFLQKLYGPTSNLSRDGLATFFDSPAKLLRRIYLLSASDPTNVAAAEVIRSVKAGIHFDGDDFQAIVEAWEDRERSGEQGPGQEE